MSARNGQKKKREFTAVYRQERDWIAAYVEEIPGVNTQGRTMTEARANLRDALKLILKANANLARRRLGRGVAREPISVSIDR